MTPSFHDLHHQAEPLLLPNAWDHASAATFAAAGFPAIGTTSLGVAAAAGLRDGAGVTRQAAVAMAKALTGRAWMVTADVEGGFSEDPGEVAALCGDLWESGIVGVNIEDGRSDGTLRDADTHAAIVKAVKEKSPGLFVNARTDTAWLGAGDLDETIRRLNTYTEAGADGVFAPGLKTTGDIERVAAEVEIPLNTLLTPAGPTVKQLGELGVARVSCGSYLFRVALGAATRALGKAASGADLTAIPAIAYDDVQALVPHPIG
jgi:2-methylisocitrate lyase-like PEP mutase family enzyme